MKPSPIYTNMVVKTVSAEEIVRKANQKPGNMNAFINGTPKGNSRFVGNKGKRKIRGMKKK